MNVITPVVGTNVIRYADFVRLTTASATYRFATTPTALTVSAVDASPFTGLSQLVSIGSAQRDIKSTANETTVTLVGVDTANLAIVLGAGLKGSQVEMWHGFFDANNQLICNELLYSQTLSNAVWTKTAVTVTDNYATAPNGTNTATNIVFPTGSLSRVFQNNTFSAVSSTEVTFSFWIKSNTGTNQTITAFLRQTGFGTVYASSSFTATQSWVRYKITGTIPAGISVMSMFYQSSTLTPTNDVLVWGLQLQVGNLQITNNVESYTPTTTTAQSGLYQFFTGFVNSFSISEQFSEDIRAYVGVITISASSIQLILQNRTAGRYTNNNAWQTFNPADTSMNRVNFIETINYAFGKTK